MKEELIKTIMNLKSSDDRLKKIRELELEELKLFVNEKKCKGESVCKFTQLSLYNLFEKKEMDFFDKEFIKNKKHYTSGKKISFFDKKIVL